MFIIFFIIFFQLLSISPQSSLSHTQKYLNEIENFLLSSSLRVPYQHHKILQKYHLLRQAHQEQLENKILSLTEDSHQPSSDLSSLIDETVLLFSQKEIDIDIQEQQELSQLDSPSSHPLTLSSLQNYHSDLFFAFPFLSQNISHPPYDNLSSLQSLLDHPELSFDSLYLFKVYSLFLIVKDDPDCLISLKDLPPPPSCLTLTPSSNDVVYFHSSLSQRAFENYLLLIQQLIDQNFEIFPHNIEKMNELSLFICRDDPYQLEERYLIEETLQDLFEMKPSQLLFLHHNFLYAPYSLSRSDLFILTYSYHMKKIPLPTVKTNPSQATAVFFKDTQTLKYFETYFNIINSISIDQFEAFHNILSEIEQLIHQKSLSHDNRLNEIKQLDFLPLKTLQSIHSLFILDPYFLTPSDLFLLFLAYSHKKIPILSFLSFQPNTPPRHTLIFLDNSDQRTLLNKTISSLSNKALDATLNPTLLHQDHFLKPSFFTDIVTVFSSDSQPLTSLSLQVLFHSVFPLRNTTHKLRILTLHKQFIQSPFSLISSDLFLLLSFYALHPHFLPGFSTLKERQYKTTLYTQLIISSLFKMIDIPTFIQELSSFENNLFLFSSSNLSSQEIEKTLYQMKQELFISPSYLSPFEPLKLQFRFFSPYLDIPAGDTIDARDFFYRQVLKIKSVFQLYIWTLSKFFQSENSDHFFHSFDTLSQIEELIFPHRPIQYDRRLALILQIQNLNSLHLQSTCSSHLQEPTLTVENFFIGLFSLLLIQYQLQKYCSRPLHTSPSLFDFIPPLPLDNQLLTVSQELIQSFNFPQNEFFEHTLRKINQQDPSIQSVITVDNQISFLTSLIQSCPYTLYIRFISKNLQSLSIFSNQPQEIRTFFRIVFHILYLLTHHYFQQDKHPCPPRLSLQKIRNIASTLRPLKLKDKKFISDICDLLKSDLILQNDAHLKTIWFHLAHIGDTQLTPFLVPYIQDINVCNSDKKTALMIACSNNHIALALFLINEGCLLFLQDAHQKTALDLTSQKGLYNLIFQKMTLFPLSPPPHLYPNPLRHSA